MSKTNSITLLVTIFFFFLYAVNLKAHTKDSIRINVLHEKLENVKKQNQILSDRLSNAILDINKSESKFKETALTSMKNTQQVAQIYMGLLTTICLAFIGYNFFGAWRFKKGVKNLKKEYEKNSAEFIEGIENEYGKLLGMFKDSQFRRAAFFKAIIDNLIGLIDGLNDEISTEMIDTETIISIRNVENILDQKLQEIRLLDNTNLEQHEAALHHLSSIGRGKQQIKFLEKYIDEIDDIELIKRASRALAFIQIREENRQRSKKSTGSLDKKLTIKGQITKLEKTIEKLGETIATLEKEINKNK